MKPMPGRAAGGERPADGGRPDGSLDDARREVARPDLARVRGEALELARREPDPDRSVEHADRRRYRAGLANEPLGLKADLDALAGRKAVRDERRLERDDGPRRPSASVTSRETSDHGIAPSWADAAGRRLGSELRAADEEARRERVSRSRRVDDLCRRARRSPVRRR